MTRDIFDEIARAAFWSVLAMVALAVACGPQVVEWMR